jgi:hypothetical protein
VLEIVLIFGLGSPERWRLADFGHDPARPQACGIDRRDRLAGDLKLLDGRVEDLRAVVGADRLFSEVSAMYLKEELKDLSVGGPLRIEDDLDRLGRPGMALSRRVVIFSAGVADACGYDSGPVSQQLLRRPETASGEDRGLGGLARQVLLLRCVRRVRPPGPETDHRCKCAARSANDEEGPAA